MNPFDLLGVIVGWALVVLVVLLILALFTVIIAAVVIAIRKNARPPALQPLPIRRDPK